MRKTYKIQAYKFAYDSRDVDSLGNSACYSTTTEHYGHSFIVAVLWLLWLRATNHKLVKLTWL